MSRWFTIIAFTAPRFTLFLNKKRPWIQVRDFQKAAGVNSKRPECHCWKSSWLVLWEMELKYQVWKYPICQRYTKYLTDHYHQKPHRIHTMLKICSKPRAVEQKKVPFVKINYGKCHKTNENHHCNSPFSSTRNRTSSTMRPTSINFVIITIVIQIKILFQFSFFLNRILHLTNLTNFQFKKFFQTKTIKKISKFLLIQNQKNPLLWNLAD